MRVTLQRKQVSIKHTIRKLPPKWNNRPCKVTVTCDRISLSTKAKRDLLKGKGLPESIT